MFQDILERYKMDEELKKKILTTGTSLVGIVCKDGVVMAGDRKTTLGGQITMRKDTQKVVPINDYLIISGTGVASDVEMLKKLIRAELRLKELRDKRRPTVKEAANLLGMIAYKNIRQPAMIMFTAGLMVGGINEDGSIELYSVAPAGDVDKVVEYDANLSSGMPYILGLLERQWKKNMTIDEGIELAIEAIKASSERDTASGFGIDVFAITKDGIRQVAKQKAEAVYTEQN